MRSFRRNAIFLAKVACASFILTFYFFYSKLNPPALTKGQPLPKRPSIQYDGWKNNTGKADQAKRLRIREAMVHTFNGYKQAAWGFDDVKPLTGGHKNSRNGWGAFIVDSSSTLAVMGMWDELLLEINYIINEINFRQPQGDVDPFETTIRYLGGLVSLIELGDKGVIPQVVMTPARRQGLLNQATFLANHLMLAFDAHTGLPWPKVNFITGATPPKYGDAVGPARAGSNFLEFCTLSKLTGNVDYCTAATRSWSLLVHNRYPEDIPGLVDARISVVTGDPVGKERHWDAGADSYYEYLLKASLLLPDSPNSAVYAGRWLQAAYALQNSLATRSAPAADHWTSHLFMGKYNGNFYANEMSHLACFAPGNLMYGGKHLQRGELVTLGLALLDTCRHTYDSSPTKLGPEKYSWLPAPGAKDRWTYSPVSVLQSKQWNRHGFWASDARFKLRPEYFESLFYAFRITGEQRYRDWAWEGFEAVERLCKTPHGYAEIKNVMDDDDKVTQVDEAESFFAGETLKYLYLIFDDAEKFSLDDWIFTTEAHPLQRNR